MGYYLIDNPPASRQFWPSRNVPLTGGVVVHTTEGVGGDDSAENTAAFISRRSEPGSYHCIVDWNSTVMLMPDDYTAFGVAADGYNSRCWMIALACKSSELAVDDWATNVMMDRAGKAIVEFWQRNGINPLDANDWIDTEVLNRAGLCQHGEAQPWDRSDAFVGHPQQWALGIMLLEAIHRHAGGYTPAPPPEPIPAPIPDLSWISDALNSARSQVLRQGSSGDAVKWLQALLNSKADAGLVVDGVFGPATDAAVRRVQTDVRNFFNLGDRMAVDGIVGPQTWFWLTLGD
jgi:hypothetical protein